MDDGGLGEIENIATIPGHSITIVCIAQQINAALATLILFGSFKRPIEQKKNDYETHTLNVNTTMDGMEVSRSAGVGVNCSLTMMVIEPQSIYGAVTTSCKYKTIPVYCC